MASVQQLTNHFTSIPGGGVTRFTRWQVFPSQSSKIDPKRDWISKILPIFDFFTTRRETNFPKISAKIFNFWSKFQEFTTLLGSRFLIFVN